MNKYIERLYQEWKMYGKIIIGVDFDDTIYPWKWKTKEDMQCLDRLIQILRIAHETGAYITIFTCSDPSRNEEILEYCKSIKLPVDSINKTPLDLPYGKHGKIYANIFIDDRAGLEDALNILETTMYKVRGDNASKLTIGESAPYTT